MKTLITLLTLTASTAAAETSVLDAYVDTFAKQDAEACLALFAPDARFIDLGNNFSDRIAWFCNAVVGGGGQYTVISQSTEGDITTFEMDYRAGGYVADTQGTLEARDGQIQTLIIERR